jgi:hypothetical protein
MGVSANEGTAYEAVLEPALIQQSLGQYFDVAGVRVDLLQMVFVLFALHPIPQGVVACMPGIAFNVNGISLGGPMTIDKTAGQTNFVNFSPGIVTKRAAVEQFFG